jgi:hypothetical protein
MRYTGRDFLRFYDETHHFRQAPQPGPRKWQDSTWLQWWDDKNKVGGVHRIGHEYNVPGGEMVAGWTNLIAPNGVFKNVTWLPLREADKLERGWGSGDDVARNEYVDGKHAWFIDDKANGVAAELTFEDYSPAFCTFPSSGRTVAEISSDHIDVGGKITGWIEMKGERFEVDGFGLRDHGWGYRDVNLILSHRYVTGCFGPDLWFVCYSVMNANSEGSIEQFGWVAKDGVLHSAKKIDMVAYVENDGSTTRGGHISITLPDGDVMEVELEAAAPGIMCRVHNMFNNNTLCRATYNGRKGSGMFETSLNFHAGTREPQRMVGNLLHTGWYPGANTGRSREAGDAFTHIQTL